MWTRNNKGDQDRFPFNFNKEFRIENQLIWYNSSIVIKGKPFLWADVYRNGLIYVHQLFEKQMFKNDVQVWVEFKLSKLRYNGLKKAIPKEWKDFFRDMPKEVYNPIPPHNYDMYVISNPKGVSSYIYKYLSGDEFILNNKYIKWIADLGPNFCESILDFAQLHSNIYRITNVAKYRSFQYKLLQRATITNIHLKEWNMLESELC